MAQVIGPIAGAVAASLVSFGLNRIFAEGEAPVDVRTSEVAYRKLDDFLRIMSEEFSRRVETGIRAAFLDRSFEDIKADTETAMGLWREFQVDLLNPRRIPSEFNLGNALHSITQAFSRLRQHSVRLNESSSQDLLETTGFALLSVARVNLLIMVERLRYSPQAIITLNERLREQLQHTARLMSLHARVIVSLQESSRDAHKYLLPLAQIPPGPPGCPPVAQGLKRYHDLIAKTVRAKEQAEQFYRDSLEGVYYLIQANNECTQHYFKNVTDRDLVDIPPALLAGLFNKWGGWEQVIECRRNIPAMNHYIWTSFFTIINERNFALDLLPYLAEKNHFRAFEFLLSQVSAGGSQETDSNVLKIQHLAHIARNQDKPAIFLAVINWCHERQVLDRTSRLHAELRSRERDALTRWSLRQEPEFVECCNQLRRYLL